jgi:amino acid transporter
MAHDGLLPPIFAKVNARTKTPWVSTIIIGKNSHLFLLIELLVVLFI